MSRFHSTVSRREFLKNVGLAGGVGAAAALAAPGFHDLDEVAAAKGSAPKRSWWIKEKDEPTVDVDWDLMARHHGFHSTQSDIIQARYYGLEEWKAMTMPSATDRMKAGEPGYSLRDYALANGANRENSAYGKWEDTFRGANTPAFIGPQRAKTPEQLGVPKWEGTPEENTKMLRAAMKLYGAQDIGVSKLDDHHKKLVGTHGDNISYSYYPPKFNVPTTVTKPMVFADVPTGYVDSATGTFYIPNKDMWEVTFTIPMPKELARTAHSQLFGAANNCRYRMTTVIRPNTQEFLRGLGYQGLADNPYRGVPSEAGAVFSGLAENSRHTIMAINPEHGSWTGFFHILTDLPLEETKPIDAGIWRFCHSCGTCAKYCPSNSIEPKGGREISYDPYPSAVTPKDPPLPGLGWDKPTPGESEYFKLGRKTYWTDMISCAGYRKSVDACLRCFGSCVFNSADDAMIHDLVRSTSAVTPLFNSFFAEMHEVFGLGLKNDEEKEEWWDMSLPSHGYSTAVTSRHGGYNKG
ncbi:reductive dehalogenase [Dehalogenimonas alkenigignens]|uniref:Reductive dehalogenase n=1 Tax=Dehalogenimonas alkenigignens TaxID=1217799 RepID=A0A0W0GL45_9CHLR|nr:reductive dehalogenase [Dehalogenimonas alkenigignens]KTB49240.1 reductive dehalogenase [Dehalogenimonas alkenigignens]